MLNVINTLIITWRSGRAFIQSTHLNLYSDCKSIPSALCTLHRYGWEQGLGSLTLPLLPAENYQIRVSLPQANNSCFIQSETDSQRNTVRDPSAGWHVLLQGSLKSLIIWKGEEKWKPSLEAQSWNVFFFSTLFCCLVFTMWPDRALVLKQTLKAFWGLDIKTIPSLP